MVVVEDQVALVYRQFYFCSYRKYKLNTVEFFPNWYLLPIGILHKFFFFFKLKYSPTSAGI